MKALGMIETYGCVTAVEALDSALKAANVSLLDMSRVKGGNVTVLIEGDVGAVQAAVSAAKASAEAVGQIAATHVIPRPAGDVGLMIGAAASDRSLSFFHAEPEREEPEQEIQPETKPETKSETKSEPKPETKSETKSETKPETKSETKSETKPDVIPDRSTIEIPEPEVLETCTVEELRKLARAIRPDNMTRKDIRFAKKQQLIDAIMRYRKQER